MTYTIRVERIGQTGVPKGPPIRYEAETEMEAIAVATYEVDVSGPGPQRVAVVHDAAGRLILAYAGRARGDAR